ncbi:MAG: ketoacyl-ACP synthase III [Deltaproteobacteria bacterium]|nr:MAG: ketoacyl-ACP synthase III [Deltaproteobacteria bacterium]
MKRIGIVGTGSYLPEKVLTNYDLEKIVDTSDEWIYTRTGIKERRVAAPDQAASDLAKIASERALEAAGMKPEEIELIIMATITPDTHCPAGANWLEAKLGAVNAVSMDITAACTGFIFALSVAEQYLKNGTFRNALVVASEVMTRTVDWTDRTSCILWGDGAGAVVLKEVDGDSGILSIHIHTDGANGDSLLLPGGGSKTTPISHESVDRKLHFLRMIEANHSFKVAVKRFSEACEEAVAHNGITLDDVKVIIPHQANLRIIQGMAKKLGVPMEKVFVNIERYGNMSSATVPVALDEAVRRGIVRKGDLVLLTAFGGGLTWGSALIRW